MKNIFLALFILIIFLSLVKDKMIKYDYDNNLTHYDFFIDESKLINNNKIPKYDTLLNNNTIQKIKDNYMDDFL